MAKEIKEETPKPKPAPVLIDIVSGTRRRQCAKEDFDSFKARGFEKAVTDSKAPPVFT